MGQGIGTMRNDGVTGTLFCFGLGYTARVLAERALAAGFAVRGTVRDPAREQADPRIPLLPFARHRPLADPATAFADVTHVLVSIPPEEAGDPVLDRHLFDLLALPRLRWLGYLSTTVVYGHSGGAWLDEDAPPRPSLERGRRRLAAEEAWLQSGLPVQVFRLAGIYGPGRNPLRKLLDGRARRIVKPGHVFCRIHVEDIASVLLASMRRPRPGAIYNVCDDEPAPPQEVIAFAADLLGVPPPPEEDFATAELSPMARSFYADSRRVANRLIKHELGVTLAYPTYREGLRALLPEELVAADR